MILALLLYLRLKGFVVLKMKEKEKLKKEKPNTVSSSLNVWNNILKIKIMFADSLLKFYVSTH